MLAHIKGETRSDVSVSLVLSDGRFGTERTWVTFEARNLDTEIAQEDTIISQAQARKSQRMAEKLRLNIQPTKSELP